MGGLLRFNEEDFLPVLSTITHVALRHLHDIGQCILCIAAFPGPSLRLRLSEFHKKREETKNV